MTYYYVNSNAQDSARNEHEVHTHGCSHPPNYENRVALGDFSTCSAALGAARAKGYTPADGCYYCVNACHTS
jgi:hypothetical protein